MGDEFIPDYSKYTKEQLVDVYSRIDKVNNPQRTMAIEKQLRLKLNIDPILSFSDDSVKKKLNNYLDKQEIEKTEKPKYEKRIKRGWIAGIVAGSLTLLFTIISLNSPDNSILREYFDELSFIDAAIVFGLTYGVYKRSKTSAILLLVFLLLPNVLVFISTGNINALEPGSIIIYFVFEAIIGISEYQKINKEKLSETITG